MGILPVNSSGYFLSRISISNHSQLKNFTLEQFQLANLQPGQFHLALSGNSYPSRLPLKLLPYQNIWNYQVVGENLPVGIIGLGNVRVATAQMKVA